MDLMDNELLEDPYYRDNLLKAYWIEYEDWEYQTSFRVDPSLLKQQVVEMVFEGLDTHADIILNGQKLGHTYNMHRTWIFDAKDSLVSNDINNITIQFASAALHDIQAAMNFNPYNLPFNYSFSRKAAYHYGWDWGPRLVTCGIWKPIKIRAYDKLMIDSALFRNDKVTINTTKSTRLYGWVDLKVASQGSYSV